MSGRILLDTSIVAALFRGDARVAAEVSATAEVFINVTVLGELLYGALNSQFTDVEIQRVQSFIASVTVLDCDPATAEIYSRIKKQLRAKGKPIPENDIWIAASAKQHHLSLAARDIHYTVIEGLDLASW